MAPPYLKRIMSNLTDEQRLKVEYSKGYEDGLKDGKRLKRDKLFEYVVILSVAVREAMEHTDNPRVAGLLSEALEKVEEQANEL